MKFTALPTVGAFLVDLQRREDERGFFARSFCVNEFRDHGIALNIVQSNVAFTRRRGTLRGLHYQVPPSAESKLVRCTQGAVYDLIVDLRAESPTYLQSFGVELTPRNGLALFVPPRFAHGYLSLTDDAEVTYLVGDFYHPACERGLRFDDPTLQLEWPIPVETVSEKDRSWPLLNSTVLNPSLASS